VRVVLVIDRKSLPPSYADMARRAVMNRQNRMGSFVLATVFVALIALLSVASPALSRDEHSAKSKAAAEQSAKAAKVFDEIMQAPDMAIPRDLLARAKAIAVFPQVIKASFVVGGEGGRGVVSRRTPQGWSDPVFFRAGGPSFGWQAGASSTDFVLLLMNDDAVSHLMKDQFALGAEAGVAAGPVGREAGAGTDALMHAEVLSYSRSRGVFAGVSLKGVVVQPEDSLNEAVYDKTARELLSNENRSGGKPADITAFPRKINQYTKATDSNN
jgi:SH3 domain-containing YSC84-like protein 1